MTEKAAPGESPANILGVQGDWIALYGNPNTGKSSLFNRLTGLRQRIGNYPGVTVERKEGQAMIDGVATRIIDLPGTYSLAARSLDEEVASDVLSGDWAGGARPSVAVCVLDASHLSRQLLLTLQVAEFEIPQILVLNFSDEARQRKMIIDVDLLSERLGIPVVETVAATGEGIEELKNVISKAIDDGKKIPPTDWPEPLNHAVAFLQKEIQDRGLGELSDLTARRAIFDIDSIYLSKLDWRQEERVEIVARARDLARAAGVAPHVMEPICLRERVSQLLEGCVTQGEEQKRLTEKLDRVFLHPVFGSLTFLVVMFLLFQSVYSWAGPVMDAIEGATGWLQELLGAELVETPLVQSLVCDGVIAGVGSVVIFLPQILILYALIALLEDSGYLARPAYLMDRLFSWTGLSGKSFVPLLSSYACAIPGIMAARTIEDPKARLATNFVSPLMSCSARLPVYVLLIGAFIEPQFGAFWAGTALFALHFLGFIVALPLAFILNRFILRTAPMPFLLEFPPFRKPRFRDLFWRVYERGLKFLTNAGSVIFAISVIIWALLYFPRSSELEERLTKDYLTQAGVVSVSDLSEMSGEELDKRIQSAQVEQSWMGRTGKFIQPVFALAGFDWKISISILASFPAREVIISNLGIIYELGDDTDEESESLREQIQSERWKEGPKQGQPIYTLPTVLALLVFYALCLQCGATVAVMAKETSWKWAVSAFVLMTSLAWLGAVFVYQVGTAWGLS
ncbi:MAG: ferrous iron transport protein B [Verrucomicrobiota bacterium]